MDDLATRLEMLLVLQWLDEGRATDGTVALSVTTAAGELQAGEGRQGVIAVMAALGELEERGRVRVALEGHGRRDPHVRLADEIRRDAEQVFGGPSRRNS